MSAGKTHLSKQLTGDLGCARISSDDASLKLLHPERFAEQPTDIPYTECLDYDWLERQLIALISKNQTAIVEGICLQDVLKKIGQAADLVVYVKRKSQGSELWHDGFHLEDYETGTLGYELSVLGRDELEYHSRCRPHEKSEIVFVRRSD